MDSELDERPGVVHADIAEQVVDFDGLQILWDARVLTPRAWTLAQSIWVAELAASAPAGGLLELCCGAGHLGLAAARRSGRALTQLDLDPVAVAYARRNARRADIEADVRCGDLRATHPAEPAYALVLADPPWVTSDGVDVFPDDPRTAIDGGPQGIDLALACLQHAAAALVPQGSVVLQIGGESQLPALLAHTPVAGGDLRLVESRTYARGLLAHFTRD